MVPDFSQLRKHSRDRTPLRSANPSDSKGSDNLKSSQQFNKQSASAPTDKPDDPFFALWTTCPSWSPIIKTERGWQTIVNHSGKKVPLVLGTVASYYRRDLVLGKRFGQLTNYLMIDIDINSPFHPTQHGIKPITEAMEAMGLCRFLIVRSSTSGGLHLYFPLADSVNALALASLAYTALTNAGVQVAGGICELFPNKRTQGAEHNGHRLPLQQGSFLLDDDFRCISNSKRKFLRSWQLCATRQDSELLTRLLAQPSLLGPLVVEQPVSIPTITVPLSQLPPISWTRFGQSNEVMRQLVNYGDRYVGLKTTVALAAWIKAVAPQLSGYEHFASPKSKQDIEHGTWAYRWSKCHFDKVWAFKMAGPDHNTKVAADAKRRIFEALKQIYIDVPIPFTPLWGLVRATSQRLFNRGVTWRTFKKHEKAVRAYIKQNWKVGLSSALEKGKKSSSLEPVGSGKSEACSEAEKLPPRLLTLRYAIAMYSKLFASFATPKLSSAEPGEVTAEVEANSEGSSSSELATGTVVYFQSAGSHETAIETRVTGKAAQPDGSLLYRLEACIEGQPLMVKRECLRVVAAEASNTRQRDVIRATAAQLRQVLGKACPFSGPGLWLVRREELSAMAWGQLCGLVGEG